jgi:choline-glycine betaine transporter
MKPVILVACFLPLIVIWIVMKLSLWISAVNDEQRYVRAESKKPHGPYVANAYEDVDSEEEEYGDRTDYR